MTATIFVSALIIVLCILAVRRIVRNRKNGKISCGGNCDSCASGAMCHISKDFNE